jgi:protein-L-isoaspartate(D-aspartate) O-methyltransferase
MREALKRGLGLPITVLAILGFSLSLPQEDEARFARLRREMVDRQLRDRDITDTRVLESMAAVPRHLFVPPAVRDAAYEDHPLPIAEGQTISQPYIVALMTQCLELKGGEKVLEIGTGSGYQAAVLSRLAAKVFSIEIHEPLAVQAADLLRRLGYANVEVRAGDGFFGWSEKAPFDAIIVTCAASRIPEPLFQQLAEGGRLAVPVGEPDAVQMLTRVRKVKGRKVVEELLDVRFVPMTGEGLKIKKIARKTSGPGAD